MRLAALVLASLVLVPGHGPPLSPGAAGPVQEAAPGGRAAASLQVGGDRLAAGMDVSFADSVAGDAMAAGASVSAEGPVRGDLLAAGGRVTTSGPVGGSVRAAGGEVAVDGTVERNVTAAGGSVRIGPGGVVGGNAYLSGGEVVVDGRVTGHLRATGEVVRILGSVDGSVDVTAERVVVGPAARVGGDLTHRSPGPAEVASGARIEGTVIHRPAEGGGALAEWVGRLVRVGAFLFTGGVLVALFPGASDRLRETLGGRPVPSVGLGLAALVGIPLALVLVGLTVLGLPLMLIGGALFAAALYVARAVLALWIGERLLGRGPARARRVAAFLVGGALLALAGLVPWVGWLVTLAATVAGLGAAVELLTRRWREGGEAAGV